MQNQDTLTTIVHNKNIVRVSDQVEIVVTSESSKFGYWVINHFYLFDLAGLINQVDGKENRLGQSLDEYVIVGDSILKHQNSDTIYVFRDCLLYTSDAADE